MNRMSPDLAGAAALLRRLEETGVHLWSEEGRLCYHAPEGALSVELRAALASRREEIKVLLERSAAERLEHTPNILALHDAGGKADVVFVHAVDGGVGHYLALAEKLSAEARAYGVTAFDFDAKPDIPLSIGELATDYAQQILRLRLKTAPVIVGWSLGGHIAFEVARGLSRLGAPPAGVLVIDSHAPFEPADASLPGLNLAERPNDSAQNRRWERFLLLHVCTWSPAIPGDFWAASDIDKCAFLLERASDRTLFIGNNAMLAARTPDDILYMFNLVNRECSAQWTHVPGGFDGEVQYIMIDDGDLPRGQRTLDFWRSLTTGRFEATWMDGKHTAALREPGLSVAADLILRLCQPPANRA